METMNISQAKLCAEKPLLWEAVNDVSIMVQESANSMQEELTSWYDECPNLQKDGTIPRMASKIIMSCMVPIFTQVTLKVMLYMLHNHAQIKLLNEPHDDVTDNVFQDDKNYVTEFVPYAIIQLAVEKPKENKYYEVLDLRYISLKSLYKIM